MLMGGTVSHFLFLPIFSIFVHDAIPPGMIRYIAAIALMVILLGMAAPSRAQLSLDEEIDTLIPDNVLLEKQWGLGVLIHTNGWGLRLRLGKNVTALRQWMWEVEYSTYKSPKEVRVINPYFSDAKSYIYGKLNSVSFLRGGTGQQFILTRKPYWGGVQLSVLACGGVTVGFAKPVYLYILYVDPNLNDYSIKEEKYDPARHYIDNIYGRASFLSGILELKVYPGIYTRAGLEFEFGNLNKRPKSLEAGALLEYSPIGIPIMAYNSKQNFFLTLYVSFMFGKRHN
jgi:hypothetical protein